MMKASKLHSLSVFLSSGLILILTLFIVLTMSFGLIQRQGELVDKAMEDIKHEVAHLARVSERLMAVEPQLLEDDITHVGFEPRVSLVATVDDKGNIVFSSDFSLRSRPAIGNIPHLTQDILQEAINVRSAIVKVVEDEGLIYGVMSFNQPSVGSLIRSLDKGVVVLVYDLSQLTEQAFNSVIKQKSLDFFVVLAITLLTVWLINVYVNRPLRLLRNATNLFAEGSFSKPLVLSGPKEVVEVTDAFNHMAQQMNRYVKTVESQNEHTQTILENVVDGIITIDLKGNIESFNAAAERIFGYSSDYICGKNVKLLMPEPYQSEHDTYLSNYMSGGSAKIIGNPRELQGLRSNGEVFPMDLAVNAIEVNGCPHFIGIVRDITERKRIDKMKNEFISTVSHELRTPLTALNGAIKLMSSGAAGDMPEQSEQLLAVADRNGEKLLRLINDLLDMEKILAGKMKYDLRSHNLQQIIDESLSVNKPYADQYQVSFAKKGLLGDICLKVDDKRLEQVLSNFLSNACKFSSAGQIVEVLIEHYDGQAKVSVIDEGAGIPLEFQSNIFQKFSQADSTNVRKRGGTGLGLSISKELVEGMGGKVGFESTEGVGSIFYFVFPTCNKP